jgi:hypothetical protein
LKKEIFGWFYVSRACCAVDSAVEDRGCVDVGECAAGDEPARRCVLFWLLLLLLESRVVHMWFGI